MSNPWTRELQLFRDGTLDETALEELLREETPQRYLVRDDLFAPGVDPQDRAAVLACCCVATQHTIFVVAEHAEEMADRLYGQVDANEILNWLWAEPCGDALSEALYDLSSEHMPELFCRWCHGVPPHLWLCPRIRNQAEADERLPHSARLADAGWNVAAWCEGMTGPVDIREHMEPCEWHCQTCGPVVCSVVRFNGTRDVCDRCGGECRVRSWLCWVYASGGSTPLDPAWVRGLRDQCQAAGVPFWFGGWGKTIPLGQVFEQVSHDRAVSMTKIDGQEWRELPEGMTP